MAFINENTYTIIVTFVFNQSRKPQGLHKTQQPEKSCHYVPLKHCRGNKSSQG